MAAAFTMFLVIVVVIGMMTPPRNSDNVRTDRLGPMSGESAGEYAARAAAALDQAGALDHWGLVTFDPPASPAVVISAVGDVRISRVVVDGSSGARAEDEAYRTLPDMPIDLPAPVEGRNTPGDALETAVAAALSRIRTFRGAFDDGVTPDCACIVGVVVRGDGDTLRAAARQDAVATVEPLAGDAVWGHFAVRAR
ncbi:hypothetical protein ONR57_19400 [Hoyosella sp. YIM 151337]|uniref:hypothetical protein n=1 Tax=Hoyosella sp. YIM 151337 TaxID=2992742 RepID=UPI0022354624|nr:hypothetical protein [Hoyosella sp. YIM 151337]MCW4355473.1 hypothetical protein [Hoyosella sp. YIM 151337]